MIKAVPGSGTGAAAGRVPAARDTLDRFEMAPVAMLDEDWSGAKRILDGLVAAGVTDLRGHVRDHPDALVDLVAGARIVDLNAAAERIYRSPDKQALIDRFNAVPDPATYNLQTGLADIFVLLLTRFHAGETSVSVDGVDTAFDGANILIRTTTTITPGFEQDWAHVVQTVEDVTASLVAESALGISEQRYDVALKGSKDGIWDWDILADTFYTSEQAASIPGLASIRSVRTWRGLLSLIERDDRPVLRNAVRRHLKGQSELLSCECRVADGGTGPSWIQIRGTVLRNTDGRAVRMAGSITDISDRKAAERALRLAMERAELASRAKSDFLANMTHELRTPLNAIIGFAELIQAEVFGPVGSPRYRSYVADILTGANHLLQVINDVLDMSKIEANMLEIQPADCDIGQEIGSAIMLVRTQADARKHRLTSRVPPGTLSVHADRRLLRQVMLNLLSNAIKFTAPGGRIEIAADVDADGVEVRVSDNGIGMSRADIERAMSPYVQLQLDRQQPTQGTGLGLPLVKRLVELHGGSFHVESAVGVGTTAIVRLPTERLIPGS